MTNSNYRRGYIFERMAFKELEKDGYFPVRSSGSHTLVDLIAFPLQGTFLIGIDKIPKIKLIQLKRVKGKYYNFNSEISEFKILKLFDCWGKKALSKELWILKDRLRGVRSKPEIEKIEIK